MKIIDKMLDNYFTKKVIEKYENTILCCHNLDHQIITYNFDSIVKIAVKPRYYNCYTVVFVFNKERALEVLGRLFFDKNFIKQERKYIEDFYKDNSWSKINAK